MTHLESRWVATAQQPEALDKVGARKLTHRLLVGRALGWREGREARLVLWGGVIRQCEEGVRSSHVGIELLVPVGVGGVGTIKGGAPDTHDLVRVRVRSGQG